MRLDKFLAHHLDISRNVVNKELKAGMVEIDGCTIKSGAYQLPKGVSVVYRGNKLDPIIGKRYFMLNKPAGYICAASDEAHPTVLYLIDEPMSHKLHAAGRLDKETTGMVLLTDDGQWSHRITSPKHHYEKEYHVTVSEPIAPKVIEKFAQGLLLKGERSLTRPATLIIQDDHHATVLLSEGCYHQVRRMFAAVGNHVVALHRQRIGELTIDLAEGEYRSLTDDEINYFRK